MKHSRYEKAGFLVVMVILATSTWAAGEVTDLNVAPSGELTQSVPVKHPREKSYMKRRWGTEVIFVRQTSAGYMLEFRYKVLDAEKSNALFDRQTKPVLTHTKSGAKLIVPTPAKTGALRNSNMPKVGKTYWMFFANPGKLVQPGDLVSIDIGEFQVSNIVVQ